MSAVDSVRDWAKARGADPFTPGQCFDALDDVEDKQQVYAAINILYTKENVLGRRKKGSGNEYVWREFAGPDFEYVPTTEQLAEKGLIPPPSTRANKAKTPVTPPDEARSLAAQTLAYGNNQQTIRPADGGQEIPTFLRKDMAAEGDSRFATDHSDSVYSADPPGPDAAAPEVKVMDPAAQTVADAIARGIAKTFAAATAAKVEEFLSRSTVRITIERVEITLEGIL